MQPRKRIITRTILVLSLVSLFTDIASEMLYPIMPIYLQKIGFSVLIIGILEGFAEAIAGLSKGYFGKLSDDKGHKLPFVQLGYAMSAISKPMMAIFTFPLWIFFARTIDRLGKGVRTGARDAILSHESAPENKGKVFGFHRSMDTVGAAIGPFLALVYLYFYPGNYKTLFFLAFAPGMLGVLLTFLVKEKREEQIVIQEKKPFWSFLHYWKHSSPTYKKTVIGFLAFTLFNSSDIFLLLIAKSRGFSDQEIIAVYIFYNLVFALSAYPIGIWADKIGLKKMYIIGLLIFASVYFGMSQVNSTSALIILFFFYGIYAAATEGISKAWISNLCDKKDTATALGYYSGMNSLFSLLASTLAGILWVTASPGIPFIVSGLGAIGVASYFGMRKFERV